MFDMICRKCMIKGKSLALISYQIMDICIAVLNSSPGLTGRWDHIHNHVIHNVTCHAVDRDVQFRLGMINHFLSVIKPRSDRVRSQVHWTCCVRFSEREMIFVFYYHLWTLRCRGISKPCRRRKWFIHCQYHGGHCPGDTNGILWVSDIWVMILDEMVRYEHVIQYYSVKWWHALTNISYAACLRYVCILFSHHTLVIMFI